MSTGIHLCKVKKSTLFKMQPEIFVYFNFVKEKLQQALKKEYSKTHQSHFRPSPSTLGFECL